MELPPLTMEQLSQLVASNAPPSQLFEGLSRYELQACIISAGVNCSSTDDAHSTLLSLFYSGFFLVHLLTDQVLVVLLRVLFTTASMLMKLGSQT